MTADVLLVEVADHVAVLTLNRPERRNALSRELLEQLTAAVARLDDDDDVRAVVLTGAGPAFSAGVDLVDLRDDAEFAATVGPRLAPVLRCATPLIGAVNGAAYTGGLELALACHFLIGSADATFADTHNRLGLMPGWGLSVLLSEAVGVRRARQVSATGEPFDADTALAWGLLNEVVPPERLLPRCREIAASVVRGDAAAVQAMSRVYDAQQDGRDRLAWRLEADAWLRPHADPTASRRDPGKVR